MNRLAPIALRAGAFCLLTLIVLDALLGPSRLAHPFVAALYAGGFVGGALWQRSRA